ncbi:MAG: penicillin-binding transpeptidase domain-containing protein, partial [Actinomycetota bacterium]
RAVAGVPGQPVSGKTGTAEFGNQVPPQSHAWFVGYQGNLAFAVFVEAGWPGTPATARPVPSVTTARIRSRRVAAAWGCSCTVSWGPGPGEVTSLGER